MYGTFASRICLFSAGRSSAMNFCVFEARGELQDALGDGRRDVLDCGLGVAHGCGLLERASFFGCSACCNLFDSAAQVLATLELCACNLNTVWYLRDD
jgi:hypothetical protein